MKKFIKEYIKKFGYNPSMNELHNLYTQGVLRLSDSEENTLIKEYSTYLELGYNNYYYNNKTKQTK
jgi:hypothetical protein